MGKFFSETRLPSQMGPAPRERYNARARQSTAGSHKKKKSKKGESQADPPQEANPLIHVPKSEEQREEDRKEKLKQEVREEKPSH